MPADSNSRMFPQLCCTMDNILSDDLSYVSCAFKILTEVLTVVNADLINLTYNCEYMCVHVHTHTRARAHKGGELTKR